MAGVGVYQPGASLAEAYVMRRLYKEKMKKARMAEEAGGAVAVMADREKERAASGGGGEGGCFSLSRVFGKKAHVHPSSAEAPGVAPPE